jgi:hypothetical protein
MANEVLNQVLCAEAARRGPQVVVKALGWGPWKGGMVNPALEAHFTKLGVPMIPLDVGARFFVEEAADRSGAVALVLGGEPRPEPLAEASGPRKLRASLFLRQDRLPWLADHTVAGKVVVPAVVALDWMAQAASALHPDQVVRRLNDVRVLRGMRLQDFAGRGDWFTVEAQEVTNGRGAVVSVEIQDAAGAACYRASAELGAGDLPPGPSAPTRATVNSSASGWEGPIYDGRVLFHGPAFQVLRGGLRASDDAAQADLTGTEGAGWGGAWQTDPALLDGGLQLALLWASKRLGAPTLPMALGAWERFAGGPGVRAYLSGSARGADRAVADLLFADASGHVVASLRQVELVRRPSE